MNQLLEAALHYADLGISIIPNYPNSKEPIGEGWEARATTDKDQIRKWWTETPEANIGGKTGGLSGGLVGIDLDEKNGQQGIEQFAEWEKQNKIKLPETPKVKTPHGGIHLYFKATSYVPSVGHGTWLQDVDTRGWTGQILLPPSIVDGERYEWVVSPEDADFASESEYAAVSFLLDNVREADASKHSKAFTAPEKILDGERNNTLFRSACSMWAKGYSPEATYAAIHAENKAKCRPPLPDKEVDEIVSGVLKRYEQGKPIQWMSTAADEVKKKGEDKPDTSTWDNFMPRSLNEILTAETPEMIFPVKDLIPEGLTIISAAPKSGKSWMMLDLCKAIAEGSQFLKHDTTKGKCLYFDLENSDRGLKHRLTSTNRDKDIPDGIMIIDSDDIRRNMTGDRLPILGDGFEDILEKMIQKVDDLRFIIIDTLSLIMAQKKRDETQYQYEYRNGSMLKRIADKHHLAIAVVHHNTKMRYDNDDFANISGTYGLIGSSDLNMIIMKEEKGSALKTLAVTGRHTKETRLTMTFNTSNCSWEFLGEASGDSTGGEEQKALDEYFNSDIRKAAIEICEKDLNGFKGKVSELVDQALNYGIAIGESPQVVGKFIASNIGKFAKYDGIRAEVRRDGTAGRTYVLKRWEPSEDATENPFVQCN